MQLISCMQMQTRTAVSVFDSNPGADLLQLWKHALLRNVDAHAGSS